MEPDAADTRCTVTVARGSGGRAEVHKRSTSATDADRLGREAAVLRRARHPGVVDLVALRPGEDGEGAVLVTRLAGTHTLATWRDPSLDDVAGTLVALAETLADLHHLGIAHGAVTADHVILDRDGRPVLCGFERRREHRPTDDVAALGELLRRLVAEDTDTGPVDGRTARREPRRRAAERRRLLALADQATDADERARPGARRFAAAVVAAVPGASIAATGSGPRREDDDRLDRLDGTDDLHDTDDGGRGPDLVPHDQLDRSSDRRRPGSAADEADEIGEVDGVGEVGPTGRAPRPASGDALDPDPSDPPRPRPPRLLSTVAAVVGLACLVFGALTAWSPDATRPTAPSAAAPVPVGPEPAAPTTRPATGPDQPRASTSPPGSPTPSFPDAAGASCAAEPARCSVVRPGGVVEHGGERFALGDPADELVLADPRCARPPAVALLRPDDGTTYVFDRWAEPGHDVAPRPGPTVPAGSRWEAVPLDAAGCAPLTVRTPDGAGVVIDPGGLEPAAPADAGGTR